MFCLFSGDFEDDNETAGAITGDVQKNVLGKNKYTIG